MAYLKARLQRYSDNIASAATTTITSGSLATGYTLAGLTDNDPSKPAKFNETSITLLFDWGTARRQDAVALIHANLAAGLAVTYQANATNVWTAPTLTAPITIPAYHANKFPRNAYEDLTLRSGYSAGGFRYGRLVISGVNPVPIAIGCLVIISENRDIEWFSNAQLWRHNHPIVDHTTDAGVTNVFDLGTDVQSFEGLVTNRPAQRAAIDTHWHDAHGRAFPFLFVPNMFDSANREAFLVRWANQVKEENFIVPGISTLSVKLTESGRGLYPTPSAV